jgi:hypothetical protein
LIRNQQIAGSTPAGGSKFLKTDGVSGSALHDLPPLNKSGKKLFVPAGSLDSESGILPGHNIFWGDRSSWYEAGISAPRSEGFVE